jgi:hypothetical protein
LTDTNRYAYKSRCIVNLTIEIKKKKKKKKISTGASERLEERRRCKTGTVDKEEKEQQNDR